MEKPGFSDRSTQTAGVAGIFVASGGAIVLGGWALNISVVQSVMPQWPRMAPIVALAFLFLGFAIRFAALPTSARPWKRKAAPFLAFVAVSMGLLSRGDHLFQWNLDVDRLFFRGAESLRAATAMSAASAIAIIVLGCALLLPDHLRFVRLFHTLALFGTLLAWVGLSRYIFGGEALVPYSRMAIHTSILALIASVGALSLRPSSGLPALLASPYAGGVLARRLVPACFIIPVAFGWLRLQGQYAGLYGTEAGVSLFALANIVTFGGLIWINAALLDRADAKGTQAAADREQFVSLVEQSEDFVCIGRSDGSLIYLNPAGSRMVDVRMGDRFPRPFAEFFPGDWGDRVTRDILPQVLQGRPWIGEAQLRSFSGGPGIDVSANLFAVRSSVKGEPSCFAAVMRDITVAKLAEVRLQAQLARLDLVSRITRAIGERQDLDSIFQVVLQTLEDSFPVDFACGCLYDALGKSLTVSKVASRSAITAANLKIAPGTAIPVDQNGLSRCVGGQLVHEPDVTASRFPFPERLARAGLRSFVAAPLSFENRVFGVLIAARNHPGSFSSGDCEFLRQLSEHVALAAGQAHTYDRLQKAYEDLRLTQSAVLQQERLRALGQMASGIAHDINNTISPVLLYTEALIERETGLSARGREELKTIDRAIQDVAQTVIRMREASRQEASEWAPAPIRVNILVEQVVELTRARWGSTMEVRGVPLQMNLRLGEVAGIEGAENEIRDALTNLILNAIDAMPDGGTLTIRSYGAKRSNGGTVDDKVCVEVCDTGVGMDDVTRRRCLEPFYTTKGERGTGLGLAMVYGMAQRHSAELEIESELANGTVVRLVFPAACSEPEHQVVRPPSVATRSVRILVVDDDPIVRKAMHDTLLRDGHSVTVADGGQAGIDAFHEAAARGAPFALVITDLGMPRVDGRLVAAAVKEYSPAIPVVILTGWGHRLVAQHGAPTNADSVLAKPPRLAELRRTISELTS
jgi:signal transduction histidine kinase/PAS domain-containing protein